jgi:hypothetical protein
LPAFQKADWHQKSQVIFKKPAKFWRVVPFENWKRGKMWTGLTLPRHSSGISGSFQMSQVWKYISYVHVVLKLPVILEVRKNLNMQNLHPNLLRPVKDLSPIGAMCIKLWEKVPNSIRSTTPAVHTHSSYWWKVLSGLRRLGLRFCILTFSRTSRMTGSLGSAVGWNLLFLFFAGDASTALTLSRNVRQGSLILIVGLKERVLRDVTYRAS